MLVELRVNCFLPLLGVPARAKNRWLLACLSAWCLRSSASTGSRLNSRFVCSLLFVTFVRTCCFADILNYFKQTKRRRSGSTVNSGVEQLQNCKYWLVFGWIFNLHLCGMNVFPRATYGPDIKFGAPRQPWFRCGLAPYRRTWGKDLEFYKSNWLHRHRLSFQAGLFFGGAVFFFFSREHA